MAYHAGFKVQDITELLVEILSYTDMTFLLCVAPRINKYWNTVVCHTPILQRILFFKPIEAPPGAKLVFANNARKSNSSDPNRILAETNSLLQKHFGRVFFRPDKPPYSWIISTIAAFRDHLPWSSRELDENAEPECTKLYEAFTYEHASWRRMLVSQPPPPQILTILESQIHDGPDPVTMWKTHIYAESCKYDFTGSESPPDSLNHGLRFGLLYDAIQSIAASCTVTPERVTHCTGWGSDLVARRVRLRPRNGVVIRFIIHESRDPHVPNTPETVFDMTFRSKGFRPLDEESYASTQWAII